MVGRGAPLSTDTYGCIFLGTLHETCRPRRFQRECYSGHKRAHGLKYQSLNLPNGLIANLYGIIPGRRHDSMMLYASMLLDKLRNHLAGNDFCIYGDAGYPL